MSNDILKDFENLAKTKAVYQNAYDAYFEHETKDICQYMSHISPILENLGIKYYNFPDICHEIAYSVRENKIVFKNPAIDVKNYFIREVIHQWDEMRGKIEENLTYMVEHSIEQYKEGLNFMGVNLEEFNQTPHGLHGLKPHDIHDNPPDWKEKQEITSKFIQFHELKVEREDTWGMVISCGMWRPRVDYWEDNCSMQNQFRNIEDRYNLGTYFDYEAAVEEMQQEKEEER